MSAHDDRRKPVMPLPMPRTAVVDRYFLEHRAKLLDLAAFLDRCDRAPAPAPENNHAKPINPGSPRSSTVGLAPENPASNQNPDFRLAALRRALQLLTDDQPDRARRILELLSDMSEAPLEHAPGKSATGAPPSNP